MRNILADPSAQGTSGGAGKKDGRGRGPGAGGIGVGGGGAKSARKFAAVQVLDGAQAPKLTGRDRLATHHRPGDKRGLDERRSSGDRAGMVGDTFVGFGDGGEKGKGRIG